MTRYTIGLTALVLFGCGAPAPPTAETRTAETPPQAAPLAPHRLAGCYALYDEAGKPASRSLYFASDRVRLDTAALARPGTWRATRLRASGGTLPDGEQGRSVYWAADSLAADTIHVHIHTGFSGSELILGVRPASPDTLHGRALEHWDLGPSTNNAGRATAVRVPCVAGTE